MLFRAKAAVIIGDPKQLRHISAIPPRRDRELLHKHDLAEGYAKWAYSENSLFDLASPLSGQDHGFGSEFQKSLRSKIIRDCAGQTAAGRSSWTA